MNKTVILYYSKTGFTKQYAQWIQESTKADCFPYAKRDEIDYSQYSAVLFGSWVHAGSIQNLKWLQAKKEEFKDKKVLVFFTGASPDKAQCGVKQEDLDSFPCFYCPGGLAYEKMGFFDRLLMRAFSQFIKKQAGADSIKYLTLSKSFNQTDKSAIEPLLNELKSQ